MNLVFVFFLISCSQGGSQIKEENSQNTTKTVYIPSNEIYTDYRSNDSNNPCPEEQVTHRCNRANIFPTIDTRIPINDNIDTQDQIKHCIALCRNNTNQYQPGKDFDWRYCKYGSKSNDSGKHDYCQCPSKYTDKDNNEHNLILEYEDGDEYKCGYEITISSNSIVAKPSSKNKRILEEENNDTTGEQNLVNELNEKTLTTQQKEKMNFREAMYEGNTDPMKGMKYSNIIDHYNLYDYTTKIAANNKFSDDENIEVKLIEAYKDNYARTTICGRVINPNICGTSHPDARNFKLFELKYDSNSSTYSNKNFRYESGKILIDWGWVDNVSAQFYFTFEGNTCKKSNKTILCDFKIKSYLLNDGSNRLYYVIKPLIKKINSELILNIMINVHFYERNDPFHLRHLTGLNLDINFETGHVDESFIESLCGEDCTYFKGSDNNIF